MLNELAAAVARALNGAFGEGYAIYQNEVPQGSTRPCFFLKVLEPGLKPLLGRRFRLVAPMDIQLFPETEGDNQALMEAGERMLPALRLVELEGGDLVRGTGLGWHVEDGVLHAAVSYAMVLTETGTAETMETMRVERGVR